MELTPELLAQARALNSAGELVELAGAHGVDLTADQAEELFAKLNAPPVGELSDDDLDNVSGGGCGGPREAPHFQPGDHVLEEGCVCCSMSRAFPCRSSYMVVGRSYYSEVNGYFYEVSCPVCCGSTQMRQSGLRRV